MQPARLLLLFVLLSIPSTSLANDSVMGGSGANLMPMKTADISMVSEDIPRYAARP